MRIVFVNRYFHPDHAATAQMLSDLAFHAARGSHPVTVITSRQRLEDPDAGLAPREQVHGLSVHRVWTTRFGRAGLAGRAVDYLSFHLSAALALLRLARRGDVVVAATDPPMLGVSAGLAARARGARLVNWLHDVFPEVAAALGLGGVLAWSAPLLARARDASLRAAECNVVLGDLMARRVRARGVPESCIRVIHNWSDGDAVYPVPHSRNALRRRLGLDGRVVIAYSGNVGRAHDLSSLAEAAARLQDLADLRFLVIGGGAGLAELRRETQARALANVDFLPYQPRERLCESLGAADVHLIALRPELEGLIVPSKLYGILAAGRAAVHLGDPDGEVGRILAEGRCGITVAPGDAAALADVLRRLHGDPRLRRSMGRRGRALFLERYDRGHAMAAWMQVLG